MTYSYLSRYAIGVVLAGTLMAQIADVGAQVTTFDVNAQSPQFTLYNRVQNIFAAGVAIR